MSRTRYLAPIFLVALTILAVPSFATPISVNGTWYNFFTQETGSFATNGSSSTNPFYAAPGNPPWTFTAPSLGAIFTILDGGHQGDVFNVFNSGSLLGTSSLTPVDANHDCGPFPNPCAADPLMSKGVFNLPAGNYSITIQAAASPFGDSSLAWFKVDPAAAAAVPEPSSLLLMGSALLIVALFRKRLSRGK